MYVWGDGNRKPVEVAPHALVHTLTHTHTLLMYTHITCTHTDHMYRTKVYVWGDGNRKPVKVVQADVVFGDSIVHVIKGVLLP